MAVRGSRSASGLALRVLKLASVCLDQVVPRAGLVLLIYHRVGGGSGLRVDLPEWLFDEQMSRIATTPGVVSLETALADLSSGAPSGDGSLVVTFDDGTADFVDRALPILVRHGVPATLYVATDFIETGRPFPADGMPASWAGLRDALSTGLISIGSHTHTHLLLDRAEPRQVIEELDRSIALIGDRLGIQAADFAYPKAVLGSQFAETQVQARFRSAVLAGTRPNRYGRSDLYRLARSPIQVDDGLRFFQHKVMGGMRLEDDLRQLVNRKRLADKSS